LFAHSVFMTGIPHDWLRAVS